MTSPDVDAEVSTVIAIDIALDHGHLAVRTCFVRYKKLTTAGKGAGHERERSVAHARPVGIDLRKVDLVTGFERQDRIAIGVRRRQEAIDIVADTTIHFVLRAAGSDHVVAGTSKKVLDTPEHVITGLITGGMTASPRAASEVNRRVRRDLGHVQGIRPGVGTDVVTVVDIIAVALGCLEHIVTVAANDKVVAASALDEVVFTLPEELVIAFVTEDHVATATSEHIVIAITGKDHVASTQSEDVVAFVATEKGVSGSGSDDIT